MMPHLGVLSTINEQAATEVFVHDCLVYLGTCVAPIGQGKDGDRCADYAITFPDGRVDKGTLSFGDLRLVPLAGDQKASITIQPGRKWILVQARESRSREKSKAAWWDSCWMGADVRCSYRPINAVRVAALTKWYQAVDLYPKAG